MVKIVQHTAIHYDCNQFGDLALNSSQWNTETSPEGTAFFEEKVVPGFHHVFMGYSTDYRYDHLYMFGTRMGGGVNVGYNDYKSNLAWNIALARTLFSTNVWVDTGNIGFQANYAFNELSLHNILVTLIILIILQIIIIIIFFRHLQILMTHKKHVYFISIKCLLF